MKEKQFILDRISMKEKQFLLDVLLPVLGILAILAIVISITVLFTALKETTETTVNLTIDILWKEDSDYYFADSDDNVYQIGNYNEINEKIMYDDMPKQRFERLNEGSEYEVKYISGMDYWISISEKEK